MFKGSIVAIITPFDAQGAVDLEALDKLIERQIEKGTQGIVPCGSTGESITLTRGEREAVIERTVKTVRGRVPVIAGTGSSATAETVLATRRAQDLGADAALVVTPAYNKPQQEGLFRHYAAVAKGCDFPIVLYNVPGRAAVNLLPETCGRLKADFSNIVACKDAAGDLGQTARLLETGLTVLSGDDGLTFPMVMLGAAGVISVAANVAPAAVRELTDHCRAGRIAEARSLNARLLPLFAALFVETNPVPVKAAAARLGLCREDARLPLAPLAEGSRRTLIKAMDAFGLSA